MSSYKSCCIQFISTDTVHEISFRARMEPHSVSRILQRGMEVYLPRYHGAIAQYLEQNKLYDDYIDPYSLYLTVVRDYFTEFGIPFSRLSYAQYPIDPAAAWALPAEMIYPAANGIGPYMKSLQDPDELYQLIQLKEYTADDRGDRDIMRSTVAAIKAVKDPAGGYRVKLVRQTFCQEPGRAAESDFSISTCHPLDRMPVELYHSRGMALTPFADGMIKLLIHIDRLETAGQVTGLFGYYD